MDQATVLPILGTAAFGLLVVVTMGILYLTLSGWKDKRRQEIDRKR
jgi:F0F1-type ATP synthase membrane subunit b/b'